jgi:type 1 glutamine amidotransferase
MVFIEITLTTIILTYGIKQKGIEVVNNFMFDMFKKLSYSLCQVYSMAVENGLDSLYRLVKTLKSKRSILMSKVKKAVIVYGGLECHDPCGVANVFAEILEKENFEVTKSETLDIFSTDLTNYDLIVPVWTMGSLTSEQEKNVCEAVASGTGIAGCHGGMCATFRNNFKWQFMTGAQWVAHPGNSNVTYEVNMNKATSSPLVEGIEDFSLTSEQYYIHIDPAVNVLATTTFTYEGNHTSNGKITLPVAFTKRWGKGKVYYNSLGHNRYIFDIPQAREMMRRGFLWASR